MSTTEEEIAEEMGDDEGTPDGIDPETGEILGEPAEPETETVDAPAPRSQKEIDALTAKLEAEAQRHTKRVAEIMGDDFALLVPNPTDWTPGFIFDVPEMHPTAEAVAELHALLGGVEPLELREAEDAEGCDKCNALGEVLTGSRKPGQETKLCSACTGTGWKTKVAPPQHTLSIAANDNGTVYTPSQPNQFPVADRWGRPAGHPHYNMEPASVGY